MKKLKLTLFTTLIGFTSLVKAQLTTTNTLTPQQLVQNVLLGAGVTASNITFTGDALQIAKFSATPSTSLGITSGILISTGNALTSDPDGPQGPNGASGTSTGFNGSGDSYLSTISNQNTFDAGVLEFDFIPQGDTVKFRYVFASEEYPEFVGSINDAFALVLSGVAPTVLSPINIATIPTTTTSSNVVSINNINANANSAYYISNAGSVVNVEFDGLTKVLTAKYKVNCGQPYHIKIAIADGSDDALDSGVFLEGGSFSSAPPISLNTNNANSAITDTLLYEDCNTYCMKFVRTGNIAAKDSFLLNVTGNAINGNDYAQLTGTVTSNIVWPTNMVFETNQDTFKICGIKVLDDGLAEGLDTLVFNISKYNPGSSTCVQANYVKLKVYLSDYHAINIGVKDSIICNSVAINLNSTPTLGTPPYTYTWQPGNITTSTYLTPIITQPTTYSVSVSDICNKPINKVITVTPSTLPVVSELSPLTFCLDSVKQVPIDITGGKPSYSIKWLIPANGITPFDTVNNVYYLQQSGTPSAGTYTIAINDQCNQKDTILFDITTIDCTVIVPNVITANGDGVNDVFKVNGLDHFPNSELSVFNRWGKKVYTSTNYKNDWKPDDNAGTYFYTIIVSDGRKFNGFFQILN